MLNPIALIASSSLSKLPAINDLVVLPSAGVWTLLGLALQPADIARYSDIAQQDAAWLSRALARQHSALAEISSVLPVYPLQFGLIVPSVEETLAAAGQHHQELLQYFVLIDGASEWSLKAALSEAAEESDSLPEQSSGLAWLKAKQSAPLRRKQRVENAQLRVQTELPAILASVRANAQVHRQAVIPNKTRTELLNIALLVESQSSDSVLNAVEKAREVLAAQGIEVSYSGPWPPYSFRPRLA